jgi:hypothetical protein
VLAAGVGLFGVLSGYLANFFLAPSSADEPAAEPVAPEPADAGASERDELIRMVEELEAGVSALRARLAE